MKISLQDINRKEFNVRMGEIGGMPVFLVEPHGVGVVKWNRKNLTLRSAVYDADGAPVSLSYPKFFNFDEDIDRETGAVIPDKIPYSKPTSLHGAEIMDKLDGSTGIISHWKGNSIFRTRGTFDANCLANGHEVPKVKAKYAKLFAYAASRPDISFITEWYSPSCKIVLNYGDENLLWLTGAVRHSDYSLLTQTELDEIALACDVARPERYQAGTLAELRATVEAMEGKEGVCIYYNGGQNILKLKSARYLMLHYYKSEVSSPEKIIELWFSFGQPKYKDFYDRIATDFDWELAEYCKGTLSKICDASKEMARMIQGFNDFLDKNKLRNATDKEAYAAISAAYGPTNRAGYVMNLKKGKPLGQDAVKKLIFQLLKK